MQPHEEREKWVFIDYILCVSHYPKHFPHVLAFNLLRYTLLFSHFINERTEAENLPTVQPKCSG